MKILSIGNSFSQDATRYLNQIAKADGADLMVVNLSIGGCPLSRHYTNMITGDRAYSLDFNGESTSFFVSLKDALVSHDWDFVTLQQVSSLSTDYETYQPYLYELSAYIKKYLPKAKQVIHQTWAYEDGTPRLCDELGYKSSAEMYNDIDIAYKKAASDINAELIIPSGSLLQKLLSKGISNLYRDTFHLSLGAGRYSLGLLWYRTLTGNRIHNNSFAGFDRPIPEQDIIAIKECIDQLNY